MKKCMREISKEYIKKTKLLKFFFFFILYLKRINTQQAQVFSLLDIHIDLRLTKPVKPYRLQSKVII